MIFPRLNATVNDMAMQSPSTRPISQDRDDGATDFAGRRVTVMGLGTFGGQIGAARFLAAHGAEVTVTDLKSEEDLLASIEQLNGFAKAGLPIRFHLGGHQEEDFARADLVVPSPAVPRDSPYLKTARARGVPIEPEMNLFFRLCPCPAVGVTGSNGKTTTTSMIGHILKATDRVTWVGGNIGRSLLLDLPDIRPDHLAVLELSSFQLHEFPRLRRSPYVAVVTNFSPNHLDWHPTVEDYADSKRNILRFQDESDWAILNADDAVVSSWRADGRGRVRSFALSSEPPEGVFLRSDRLIARAAGMDEVVLIEVSDLPMPGVHNVENAAAAAATCLALDVPPDLIAAQLRRFPGVPHRLEHVRDLDRVAYWNDSKATTPEAAAAALRSFDASVVLIAGGYDKHLDFAPLVQAAKGCVRLVLTLGQTADQIRQAFQASPEVEVLPVDSLGEAVAAAHREARPGDVVLLSPACASWDQFQNFEARGDQFRELVRGL